MIRKLLLSLLAILMACSPVWASDSILHSSTTDPPTNSATRFGSIYGFPNGDFGSTEPVRRQVCSASGTISRMRVSCTTAPGSGNTWQYTTRLNDGDTALLVQLTDSETADQNLSDSFSVVGGDWIDLEATPTSSPVLPGVVRTSLMFSGTTAGESMLFANSGITLLDTTTKYLSLGGVIAGGTTTETLANMVVPTGGTIKNLYVKLSVAPSVGDTRVITVRQNEATTLLVVSITGTATTGNNTSTSLTVAAGDRICIESSVLVTPADSAISAGVTFVADNAGEFIIPASNSDDFATASTEYMSVTSGNGLDEATEANVSGVTDDITITKAYVQLSGAPDSGNDYTFDLRRDTSSPGLQVIVSDAETADNATGSVTFTAGQLIATQIVPNSSPTARTGMVSYLATIAETARRVILMSQNEPLEEAA